MAAPLTDSLLQAICDRRPTRTFHSRPFSHDQPQPEKQRALSLLLLATLSGGCFAVASNLPGGQTLRCGSATAPGPLVPLEVSEEKGLSSRPGVPVTCKWFDGLTSIDQRLNAASSTATARPWATRIIRLLVAPTCRVCFNQRTTRTR